VGALSAHAREGAASLYAKGNVVWPGYGVFKVRAHEFLRNVCT